MAVKADMAAAEAAARPVLTATVGQAETTPAAPIPVAAEAAEQTVVRVAAMITPTLAEMVAMAGKATAAV
jgi:hypothetical protein